MGEKTALETDYLVVGAGTLGMAFVDALIENSDADVVMVDRRHRPGGHWLDSYPFVQLHQPSMFYGVNSTALGHDRVEPEGRDAGFYERATGTEICGYFDEIMRHRLLASGRVRFFPMCDYLGERQFKSLLTDEVATVDVRRRVVDATYMQSRVPATDPPPFDVAEGVQCVPVGELTAVREPPAGYVIVGGGKTAFDAIGWLLDRGTDPHAITWIRPRDAWLVNRTVFQPGAGVVPTFEGVVHQVEAVAESDSVEEVFERLEEQGLMMRTDRSVSPGLMRGATINVGELEDLRRIENVVRLGYVERIEPNEIVLQEGSIPTSPDHLHVHCASPGLGDQPPVPIFGDDTIILQVVTRISLPLSAAMTGFVESTDRTTAEKNAICRPNPWPQTPFGWLHAMLTGMRTEMAWQDADDVQAWVDRSRLNLMRGLDDDEDRATVQALQGRLLEALFPALAKIDQFAEQASPADQARIYEPA
jgi:hypothetical protein